MVGGSKIAQIALNAVMIVLSLFCLLPFVLLIVSSLTAEKDLIQNGYSFFTGNIDFSAYKYLLMDSKNIIRGYGISALTTVVGTTLNVMITVLFAYALSRKDLPGKSFISFFLFFTMLFNGGLVPSYMMWTQVFHIKNTFAALIAPNLLMGAFYVIMMRTYITTNIPDVIIEAGRIDGASEMRILFRLVLPMSLPIMATVTLLVGLGYWNDWLNGLYYISNDKYYGIQVILNKMLLDTLFVKNNAGTVLGSNLNMDVPTTAIKMAVATLGALPVLIVYPLFQKYFVKGITIGAVKG